MKDALPPHQKLREFMEKRARPGTDIKHYLTLIDEALARFASPLPPAKGVAKEARALTRAAGKCVAVLERVLAPEMPNEYIMREGTGSIWRIWSFLRIAGWTGDNGFGDDSAPALRFGTFARPARCFDSAAGDELDLLFRLKAVERQARIAGEAFSAQRRPPNFKARILSYELEGIWKAATGERAGYSGEARIDKPRSRFGTFVKLALETTDWPCAARDNVFRQIVGLGVKSR
jgi:hypothetical protein